jgi:hypothetical protein
MFMCRLARDLGLTLGDMLDKMTTVEFVIWAAYYKMEADENKKAMDKAKARSR